MTTGGAQAVRDPEHIFLYLWENNLGLAGCWSFQPVDDFLGNLFQEFELSGRGKSQRHISVQWRGQAQTAASNDRWKQTKC